MYHFRKNCNWQDSVGVDFLKFEWWRFKIIAANVPGNFYFSKKNACSIIWLYSPVIANVLSYAPIWLCQHNSVQKSNLQWWHMIDHQGMDVVKAVGCIAMTHIYQIQNFISAYPGFLSKIMCDSLKKSIGIFVKCQHDYMTPFGLFAIVFILYDVTLLGKCKKDVTPVRYKWSYVLLALNHWLQHVWLSRFAIYELIWWSKSYTLCIFRPCAKCMHKIYMQKDILVECCGFYSLHLTHPPIP